MRVPKHFSPKEPASRRNLAAAFRSRLAEIDLGAPALRRAPGRRRGRSPGRGPARPAAARPLPHLPRPGAARPRRRAGAAPGAGERPPRGPREHPDPHHRDRVRPDLPGPGVARLPHDRGAAAPREQVSDAGRMLARIYGELDLVAAECIRAGVFDGLTVPQLAAVLSSLVFEARRSDDHTRRPRMPDAASSDAMTEVRRVWREVSLVERDARLTADRRAGDRLRRGRVRVGGGPVAGHRARPDRPDRRRLRALGAPGRRLRRPGRRRGRAGAAAGDRAHAGAHDAPRRGDVRGRRGRPAATPSAGRLPAALRSRPVRPRRITPRADARPVPHRVGGGPGGDGLRPHRRAGRRRSWVPTQSRDEAATVSAVTRSWSQLGAMLQNVDVVHALFYSA